MADIYKIAVSLAMTSNAPAFLTALTNQLHIAHVKVKDLEGGLKNLSRIKLAVGGGLGIFAGSAIVAGIKNVTDHARELSKELATLKTQGLTGIQIKGADQIARATTKIVPGSTESGNLKLMSEAYSLMGLENAKKALPDLARTVQVFGAIDGNYKKASESLYSLLRSGEMLGKLQDEHTGLVDPEKLKGFLDVMAKVSAATGNKVNAGTLFGMVQQGAPALANMDDSGLMTMLMAAQQMGGPRAGTALTSMYQQFQGGTMTEARAKELNKLGLIGDYNVGRGGHLTFGKDALNTDFAKALESNPLHAMDLLKEAMKKGGFNTIEAQTKELFMILGRQTTQRLVSDFLRNMTNMGAEQGRLKGGQGLDDQANTRNNEDYSVVEHNMHEAWKNLMEAIAGPNAVVAIGIMKQLTDGINWFTDAVRKTPPETIQNIAIGIGALGLTLTGAGGVALLAALGPAGWITAGIIGLAAATTIYRKDIDGWQDAILKPMHDFGDAIKGLASLGWDTLIGNLTKLWDTLKNFLNGPQQSFPGSEAGPISYQGGVGGARLYRASFGGAANENGPYSRAGRTFGGGGSGGGLGGKSFNAPAAAGGDSVYGMIEQAAKGDPRVANTMKAIFEGESNHTRGQYDGNTRGESSWGPFQLNKHGGLGALFQKETGLDPANPATVRSQATWVADYIKKGRGSLSQWRGLPHGIQRIMRGQVHPHDNQFSLPSGVPPTAGAPPHSDKPTVIENKIHLDGKMITASTTRYQARQGQFPTSVGGPDTHGSYTNPGTPLNDVA